MDWFERILIIVLLLLAFALRVHDITTVPTGFSDDEITAIRITEEIRDGTIRVFYDTGQGGAVSLFHMAQVAVTTLVGESLLGFRLLPLWAGLIELALLYTVTRRLFDRKVAIITATAIIFGIWPTLAAHTATHISLIGMMVIGTLWIVSRAFYLAQTIRPRSPKTAPYTLVALAITITVYTHYTGILAGLGIFAFLLYLYYTRQPVSRDVWWNSGYALTLALILSLPYLISLLRNISNSGLYFLWLERPTDPIDLLRSIGHTFQAFFYPGDSNPTHNLPRLPLTSTPEGGIFVLVGLVVSVTRWRQPRYALVIIFFGLGLLPDMWMTGGPNFGALAFANPLVYILLGIGVIETFRILSENIEPPERLTRLKEHTWLGKWPQPLVRVIAVLVVIMAARYIWIFNNSFLTGWTDRDDTQRAYHANIGHIAVYLDHTTDGPPVLICSSRIGDTEGITPQPSDQQLLEWMLHQEAIPFRIANCGKNMVLISGGESMRVLFTDEADISTIPPVLQTWFQPELATRLAQPQITGFLIDAEHTLANKGGQLQVNSLVFYPREPGQEQEPERAAQPTRFGGNMTFLGHEPLNIGQATLQPGNTITITTYWRVDGSLLPNTGVFIRLHDTPQASPYSEVNQFEVEATRLQPRDVVIEASLLILPETLREQEYRLTIGVYDGNPINQLPVYDGKTNVARGSYLLLGLPFVVVSP